MAIIGFFVAFADSQFSADERKMMGVVFTLLRVAMVAILVTTLTFWMLSGFAITPFILAELLVIVVLFINAILMTAHIMPKSLGPALQAGSWYTLGTLAALVPLDLTNFGLVTFILAYIAGLVLAIAIVNGIMGVFKKKQTPPTQPPA